MYWILIIYVITSTTSNNSVNKENTQQQIDAFNVALHLALHFTISDFLLEVLIDFLKVQLDKFAFG